MSRCHGWMITKRSSDLKVYSHYFKLYRSYSILFNLVNLAKFSLGAYLLLSKLRKRKRQFLCCVRLLHKAGS